MPEAKAKAKAETKEAPDGGGRKKQEVTAFRGVETWLVDNRGELSARLPKHVNRDRFEAVALEAVRQNPALLRCTPRSLFNAFRKAAADGILPDGREGVITPYKDEAQWNPMIFGLRKRARELDELLVDAQVVYANDHFIWHQGDEPKLEHTPAALGQPRGEMIGAYAIYKRGDEILHREVMDKTQIQTVRGQSRAPDSLMWKKFPEEAWRKVVARRGFKSVPALSEKLDAIIRSDDEHYDFQEQQPVKHPVAEGPKDVKSMLDQLGSGTVIDGEVTETEGSTTVLYDPDTSAGMLQEFLDQIPGSPSEPNDFLEFIEAWRPEVAMMAPADQKKAVAGLEQAACDIIGTEAAAKLPLLI